ncbi:MAG: outer membrane beta-barrel protein, partial [Bacteroidota bacterium]
QRFGIAESYVFDKVNWWTSSNSVDVNYTISKFDIPQEEEDQKGFNAIISTNNDFILNADKTLLLHLGYWYSFDGIDDIFDIKAMSSLSLSLQLLLLNKNLNITLAGTDIFRGENDVFALTVNGVYQEGRYYYDSRSFRLSVSYRFGNKNLKARAHKTGNQRERGRSGY